MGIFVEKRYGFARRHGEHGERLYGASGAVAIIQKFKLKKLIIRWQTRKEEIVNSITHGIGVILSLVAIPPLVLQSARYATKGYTIGVIIFSIGIFSVYLSSTFFHYATQIHLKKRLRTWDHISIFLLIAGTYTPIMLKYLQKPYSVIFLGSMWSLVAVGIFIKIFLWHKQKFISLGLYLALGWMAIFFLKPIITNMPIGIFWWVLAGGLFYTLGVPFFTWRKLKYSHAIWHCFVLAGSACHFVAIYESIPVVVKF